MALSGNQRRRLDERLAVLQGSASEQQYLLHLQSPAGAAELSTLIAVVAVHKTDLFRDEVQLACFRSHVLEPLVKSSPGRPLRVWSAGCATGEEVATLLILLEEAGAEPGSTVLGTDISEPALSRARTLSFLSDQIRRLPAPIQERYFALDGARGVLAPELRERASFQLHNLMETPYPTAGSGEGFDIIFCRNVLIYFTSEAFDWVVEALAERLAPGGTLVLSAAEPLLRAPPSLRISRGEQAFFYVRTPDLMAAVSWRARRAKGPAVPPTPPPVPERPKDMGGQMGSSPPARLEPQRDSGHFAAVSAAPAPRDSGLFPAVPAPRDSGRFPAAPAPRDSGLFPAAPTAPALRDSGHFAAVPAAPTPRDSGRFPAVPAPRDSGLFPVAPAPRDSGHFSVVGSTPQQGSEREAAMSPAQAQAATSSAALPPEDAALQAPGPYLQVPEDPLYAEADSLFALVLEGAGEQDARTEEYLRRCLVLDPDLAAARYLLGMLLELREAFAEAAAEYRRALHSLEEGRARPTPFFLNHARLRVACARAVERMEAGGRPR